MFLKTVILIRFPNSLTITGSKPCGICGKRAWASIGVDPTPNRGCVCCAGWRKITMAFGLPQLGSITFRYIRRLSRACRVTEVGDISQRFQPKEHQGLVLG